MLGQYRQQAVGLLGSVTARVGYEPDSGASQLMSGCYQNSYKGAQYGVRKRFAQFNGAERSSCGANGVGRVDEKGTAGIGFLSEQVDRRDQVKLTIALLPKVGVFIEEKARLAKSRNFGWPGRMLYQKRIIGRAGVGHVRNDDQPVSKVTISSMRWSVLYSVQMPQPSG